jgi:hypothetical protein
MARKGRPRRPDVERTLCGKIIREDRMRQEPADDVASWPRVKELAKTKAGNPVFATEIGRLVYFDKIRPVEGDAAKEYANMVYSYRRYVSGAPFENPRASSLEIGLGRENPPEPTEYTKEQKEAIERLKDRYDKAYIALVDRLDGVKIMRAVNSLCLEDSPLDYQTLLLARKGLMALAKLFGLTKPLTRGLKCA